jgi:hypothetical protein
MIVKCQKPLAWAPEEGPEVLIYDESQSIMFLVPYTVKWTAWFGHKKKRYAQAYYRNNKLVIGRVVSDRDW